MPCVYVPLLKSVNNIKTNNTARIPTFKELLKSPILMLGFGFGSGLAKKAPGTFGTLLGLLLFVPLLLWNEIVAGGLLTLSLLFGSYICGKSAEIMQTHDHGGIVWDEFIGIWLVLLFLPEQNLFYWLLAFGFFRLFDIWKPWPINLADKKIPGGLGIMVDDIVAALFSIVTIWAVFSVVGVMT